MISVGRRLVIGIDFSRDDEPIIGVQEKLIDGNYIYLNTLTGEDAIRVYEQLTNTKIEGRE